MAELARGFHSIALDKPPETDSPDEPLTLDLGELLPDGQSIDPDSGALKIEIDENGSVEIDFNPLPKQKKTDEKFDSNLAEHLDKGAVDAIGSRLLSLIEADDQSRQEWLQMRADGIDLLGFKLEQPRGDSGASTAPVEGMSTVRHPLLAEAVIRFQSNASAELLPAWGPVKVRNDSTPKPKDADTPDQPAGMGHNGGPPMPQPIDELAEALEKDLNYYLTVTDRGYRADVDRMLFWVGFGGCGFRKVYNDPIRRMPLSRAVDAADLIVNHAENDFDDCRRVTHRIMMRRSQVVRMQLAGVYRDASLGQPVFQLNAVDQRVAESQGFSTHSGLPEDNLFTIYECYCELDIPGFEHKGEDGKPTGLELPYRVTIDKDSRQVLEIRRNWAKEDENCLAKKVFVKYPFVPAFGFYGTGLLHILGNATKALTAAWREALDSGMFANFPGFLYADTAGRQVSNEFRVPPGGGVRIQTGGKPINQTVMPLPYKEMGPGFMQFISSVEETAQRVGGTAELQVGEGKQDAPVGTTLALIEQATKMLSAVHIRLHQAQSEELQLLKDRLREDPGALWRHNKKPALDWQVDQFLAALDNYDLVPAADPNNPSHMQRMMKANFVKQTAMMGGPNMYDMQAVDRRVFNMVGISDVDGLFNQNPQPMPAGPPPDPTKQQMVDLKKEQLAQQSQNQQAQNASKQQLQASTAAARDRELAVESADRAADRASRERVAQMREETEKMKIQGEAQQHMTPSGDTIVGAQRDIHQHTNPSADAMLGHQSDIFQHTTPSGADQLGAHVDMHQNALHAGGVAEGFRADLHKHFHPSADAMLGHHADMMAHQADMVQHFEPSGAEHLSAETAMAQHFHPSGDAETAAETSRHAAEQAAKAAAAKPKPKPAGKKK